MELCQNVDVKVLQSLIISWMTLPHSVRKQYSYDGAIKTRPGCPVHFKDHNTGISYFDPTNRVYQIGFDFLFPELATQPWNVETKGDIVESILGYGWQMELAPSNIKEPWQLAVRRLSRFLDEIFYHIYCTC